MNTEDLPPMEAPPKDHDCDDYTGKVAGEGGVPMLVCTACEYHNEY